MSKNHCRTWLIFGILLFLVLTIISACFHPYVVLTHDDWWYIGYGRPGYPTWNSWNPTRILPEVLMPFCGLIGAKVIYPITGDYMGALTIAIAVVSSIIISTYVCTFGYYVQKRIGLSKSDAMAIAGIFYLLHYLVLKTKNGGNPNLLGAETPTHFFFYTAPVLMNMILVFYFETVDDLRITSNPSILMRRGILLLAIYVVVFSNLYSNGVLAIYAGIRCVTDAIDCVKKRDIKSVHNSKLGWYTVVIVLWLVSAIFEYNGGRSQSFENEQGLFAELPHVLSNFWDRIKGTEPVTVGVFVAVLIIAGVLIRLDHRKRKDGIRSYGFFWQIPCIGLEAVYLILLSAKTVVSGQ